jgi:hypothetical protein
MKLLVSGLMSTLVVAAVAVALFQQQDQALASYPQFDVEHSAFTPTSVRGFNDFPVFSLGDSFESLPMTAILRRDQEERRPDGTRSVRDYVSFVYGDCDPGGQGCAPPFEVQVWPACARSSSEYTLTPDGDPLPAEHLTLRGVPAAFFEAGQRLELYSGSVTIVIFGSERTELLRAALALRQIGPPERPRTGSNLLPPVPGAMQGALAC